MGSRASEKKPSGQRHSPALGPTENSLALWAPGTAQPSAPVHVFKCPLQPQEPALLVTAVWQGARRWELCVTLVVPKTPS